MGSMPRGELTDAEREMLLAVVVNFMRQLVVLTELLALQFSQFVEATLPTIQAWWDGLPPETRAQLLRKSRHEARYLQMMKRSKWN